MHIKVLSLPLRRSCLSGDHMGPDEHSHHRRLRSLGLHPLFYAYAHQPQMLLRREPCAQALRCAVFDDIVYRQMSSSLHACPVCCEHI